jgi:Tfp pilus assembly protein PilF
MSKSLSPNADAQIGRAWGMHREGRHMDAIKEFEQAIQVAPHSVDAYYGLGLAQRANGQETQAVESFKKSLDIATKKLQAIRELDDVDGDIPNNLVTLEYDRYMMLKRMIAQRLAELGVSG